MFLLFINFNLDYSSSQPSLSGPGNDSMNIRENVIHETQSGYGGNNGGHSWICLLLRIRYCQAYSYLIPKAVQ